MKIIVNEQQLNNLKRMLIENNSAWVFTPSNFANFVKNSGIRYPDIAIAQSMIETANFSSHIFKANNNLFGMQRPERRQTTASGEKNGHAYYNSWVDSVKDYKLWQDSWPELRNVNKQVYLKKLNDIYCHPPTCGLNDYAKKVSSLLGKANTLFTAQQQTLPQSPINL